MENENIFDKINQNFFGSEEKANIPTKSNNKESTIDDSLNILKLVRHIPQSETKNASPIIKKIEIAFPEIDEQKKIRRGRILRLWSSEQNRNSFPNYR